MRGQCEQVAGVERCVCEEGYSGQNCDIGEDRQTDRLESPSGMYRPVRAGSLVRKFRCVTSIADGPALTSFLYL